MRQYKLTKTLKNFRERLVYYPPSALREAKRALDKIEIKYGILPEPDFGRTDAVEKELLIAQYQEMHASDAEIEELLRRAGFS
jgi:hypothetical protein